MKIQAFIAASIMVAMIGLATLTDMAKRHEVEDSFQRGSSSGKARATQGFHAEEMKLIETIQANEREIATLKAQRDYYRDWAMKEAE